MPKDEKTEVKQLADNALFIIGDTYDCKHNQFETTILAFTPDKFTDDTIRDLVYYALRVMTQRRITTTAEDIAKFTADETKTAVKKLQALATDINANTYTFGAGGGKQLDPADVEYRAVLDSLLKALGQTSKERTATMAKFDRASVIMVAAVLQVQSGKGTDPIKVARELTTKIAAKVKTRLADLDDLLA